MSSVSGGGGSAMNPPPGINDPTQSNTDALDAMIQGNPDAHQELQTLAGGKTLHKKHQEKTGEDGVGGKEGQEVSDSVVNGENTAEKAKLATAKMIDATKVMLKSHAEANSPGDSLPAPQHKDVPAGKGGTGNPWFNSNPLVAFQEAYMEMMRVMKDLKRAEMKNEIAAMVMVMDLANQAADMVMASAKAEAMSHFLQAATGAIMIGVNVGMMAKMHSANQQAETKYKEGADALDTKVTNRQMEFDKTLNLHANATGKGDQATEISRLAQQEKKHQANVQRLEQRAELRNLDQTKYEKTLNKESLDAKKELDDSRSAFDAEAASLNPPKSGLEHATAQSKLKPEDQSPAYQKYTEAGQKDIEAQKNLNEFRQNKVADAGLTKEQRLEKAKNQDTELNTAKEELGKTQLDIDTKRKALKDDLMKDPKVSVEAQKDINFAEKNYNDVKTERDMYKAGKFKTISEARHEIMQMTMLKQQLAQSIQGTTDNVTKGVATLQKGEYDALLKRIEGFQQIATKAMNSSGESFKNASDQIDKILGSLQSMTDALFKAFSLSRQAG